MLWSRKYKQTHSLEPPFKCFDISYYAQLKALIRDELRQKFKGKGDINKCKNDAERTALQWLRVEMGWTLPEIEGNPLIYPNPWRNNQINIL